MNQTKQTLLSKIKEETSKLELDRKQSAALAEKAILHAQRNRKRIKKFGENLFTLIRLLKAWASGHYRKAPWKSLIYVLGAVIYFLNPLDLIPDPIYMLGFVDDAAVVGLVFSVIKSDISKFSEWELANKIQ